VLDFLFEARAPVEHAVARRGVLAVGVFDVDLAAVHALDGGAHPVAGFPVEFGEQRGLRYAREVVALIDGGTGAADEVAVVGGLQAGIGEAGGPVFCELAFEAQFEAAA